MLISPIQFQKINLARAEATQHWDGCTELDAANRTDLLDHLLRLDRCEKNNRFQSGASDSFITRYYLGINWDRHVAIAWRQYGLMIGIAELAASPKIMAPTGTGNLRRLAWRCGLCAPSPIRGSVHRRPEAWSRGSYPLVCEQGGVGPSASARMWWSGRLRSAMCHHPAT